VTVNDLCDRYWREYAGTKKPRSQDEDHRLLKAIIRPQLGSRAVASIRYEDVERLMAGLKNTPYQANRVASLMSKMFALAEKWRLIATGSNPCRGVTRYKERSRQRYLTADEARALADALRRHEEDAPDDVAFIYLLLMTGARPDEIARAEPDWLQELPSGAVLRLPDSKTGERTVYLPPGVAALLTARRGGALRRFFSRRPTKLWATIRAEIGAPDLRLYDLRHQFASAALAAGYSLDQIGELLGHRSTQTTKRYAHLIPSKAHEVAAGTSALLERMMTGGVHG
jgi:integrase